MADLDRFEEFSREQREAGGPYAPEYDVDVDRDTSPLPTLRRVRVAPHLVDRVTGQPIGEVVEHGLWAPTWEPPENWIRTVTVRRTSRDGQPETRVIDADRLEVRSYRDVVEP